MARSHPIAALDRQSHHGFQPPRRVNDKASHPTIGHLDALRLSGGPRPSPAGNSAYVSRTPGFPCSEGSANPTTTVHTPNTRSFPMAYTLTSDAPATSRHITIALHTGQYETAVCQHTPEDQSGETLPPVSKR